KRGAHFANPCFTQIHPTCIPRFGETQSKLTLMSESLRNDGRVWVPARKGDNRKPVDIPEAERDYYLETKYPAFGNLVPRDIASRNAEEVCNEGRGVGPTGYAVYLDFADSIKRLGKDVIAARYGNLFAMYHEITGDDPYETPMMIYPAPHYTMGGLWVDYNLMTTIDGLFALGEANFSDHGANRLGASALMQGLADGYFVIPYTLGNYLATEKPAPVSTAAPEFAEAKKQVDQGIQDLMNIKGKTTADEIHRQLGDIMIDKVGMSRSEKGLKEALKKIPEIRKQFLEDLCIPGDTKDYNKELEKAGRVADFLELGELMAMDALERKESCGGHFRVESQDEEGEAKRDDENFCHAAVWKYNGPDKKPERLVEELQYEYVIPSNRSYK
ncbi:MAG: succinate dehydrogenase (quinone) flavoprotein subunit, partial [Kiritimatiellia bacterium]